MGTPREWHCLRRHMIVPSRVRDFVPAVALGLLVLTLVASQTSAIDGITGSSTYRTEVVGRVGVVAAGRHFAEGNLGLRPADRQAEGLAASLQHCHLDGDVERREARGVRVSGAHR